MKKIAISLGIIGVVAAIVVGGTIAYFSDTETSTGNTFTAGAIDLKIDNKCYLNGESVASCTWDLKDLKEGDLFFDFSDLKPGDIGEDTISIHVDNNDAWVCMSAKRTADDDMTCTEPELDDDSSCVLDNGDEFDGELGGEINFVFWADDGDNVLEVDEHAKGVFEGTIRDFESTSPRIVADSTWNIFTGAPRTPLTGGQTYYIGKAWCFGALTLAPVTQGDGNSPTIDPGVSCDGTQVNNASQSDMVMGNISFYAEQARNNESFVCSGGIPQ